MPNRQIPASFGSSAPATGDRGQRAHPESIAQTARLEPKLYRIGSLPAWSLVGNGLSNQNFVEGPEGLIVIDTGECVEEMRSALAAVRGFTDAPVVACIYTHFHYVNGTRALVDEAGIDSLPIFGHAGIDANLRRFGGEAAPRYARGLLHQFGVALPDEGPDAVENVGLGRFFRNPEHSPYSAGYVPANHTFEKQMTAEIAGLEVVMTHAPSDASDSITIWFPELRLAVNNLVWPALFNVFAIRGEEYRDPRVVLAGLDHLRSLACEHLLAAHGPPLSGADEVRCVVTDYRDAIQFLWDQTVRGANKGLSLDELTEFVQLPERFERTFYTRQLYGLVEHHVRQIYTGLFGWFDEDQAKLLPLPPADRAARLIEGFGGAERVREHLRRALVDADYRWAVELASWLVRGGPDGSAESQETGDRCLLAEALKSIAYTTPSANVRNWCLTRALELEGALVLDRYRVHRLRVSRSDPAASIEVLRVLLDPVRAGDLEESVAWDFSDGASIGLTLRGGVAVPDDGAGATHRLHLSAATWAELVAGKIDFDQAISAGDLKIVGNLNRVRHFLSCFEVAAFA